MQRDRLIMQVHSIPQARAGAAAASRPNTDPRSTQRKPLASRSAAAVRVPSSSTLLRRKSNNEASQVQHLMLGGVLVCHASSTHAHSRSTQMAG